MGAHATRRHTYFLIVIEDLLWRQDMLSGSILGNYFEESFVPWAPDAPSTCS